MTHAQGIAPVVPVPVQVAHALHRAAPDRRNAGHVQPRAQGDKILPRDRLLPALTVQAEMVAQGADPDGVLWGDGDDRADRGVTCEADGGEFDLTRARVPRKAAYLGVAAHLAAFDLARRASGEQDGIVGLVEPFQVRGQTVLTAIEYEQRHRPSTAISGASSRGACVGSSAVSIRSEAISS